MLDTALSADVGNEPPRLSVTQCQVCFELTCPELRPCCRGSVCDPCLRRHVETQLAIGNIHIVCPCVECDRFVSVPEVRSHLNGDHDLLAKYERWIDASNRPSDPHRKACPRCCSIIELEPSSLSGRTVAKCGLEVRCGDCQLAWCFQCRAPGHRGMTCKAFHAGDKLLKRWAAEVNSNGDHNARQCPKCKTYIERDSGCLQMTCRQCHVKFCYRCGKVRRKFEMFGVTLEHHDQPYSILGCNGTVHSRGGQVRRNIIRTAIIGGKVVAGAVVVVVGAPLVIIFAGVYLGAAMCSHR